MGWKKENCKTLKQSLPRCKTHVWNDNGMVAPADVASKKPSNCYLLLQMHAGGWNKLDDPPAPGFRCDAPYYTGG